jgi:hypothetical protein
MCICWKIRQKRLGIDDFGNKLVVENVVIDVETEPPHVDYEIPQEVTEETPLLVSPDDVVAVAKKGLGGGSKRRLGF